MHMAKHLGAWVAIVAVALAAGAGISWAMENTFSEGNSRPLILCFCLIGLNVVTYSVWPSRWNVLAHIQLGFSVVAYVIPILSLHLINGMDTESIALYYKVIAVGFIATLVGCLAGAAMVPHNLGERVRQRWDFTSEPVIRKVERRTKVLATLAVAGIAFCFYRTGVIPAFAPDPIAAKFFKGAYAAAYQPVAPIYRASTTIIPLLMPLIAAFAWRRRTVAWGLLMVASVTIMLLGLLREPALAGLLLFIGVAFAVRGRGLLTFFALLAGVYVVGGAFYSILYSFGIQGFADDTNVGKPILEQIASGAPDVSDQVTFLRHWFAAPTFTDGRTYVGGLVPSNYVWNPSVWSLHVVNPGVKIRDIHSGGLRLPGPVWAYVSNGWTGVILFSALRGFLLGFLAKTMKGIVTGQPLVSAVCWFVIYAALMDLIGAALLLSYLSVVALAVLALVFWRTRRRFVGGDDVATEAETELVFAR